MKIEVRYEPGKVIPSAQKDWDRITTEYAEEVIVRTLEILKKQKMSPYIARSKATRKLERELSGGRK